MAEVTSTPDGMTVIVLSPNESDSLAAVLHEHVIMGEMYAGHNGPIRRAYPYLAELAEAMG
jgi:aromatic ring-opening dioxygenase LigB subunit